MDVVIVLHGAQESDAEPCGLSGWHVRVYRIQTLARGSKARDKRLSFTLIDTKHCIGFTMGSLSRGISMGFYRVIMQSLDPSLSTRLIHWSAGRDASCC